MVAMNNTSSAIWASLAVLFAGFRVFFWLKQYVFSGCVGILFCPFCHSCAWDVWTSTLTAGAGLRSWQHVYSSSLCCLVVGRKHAEGRTPGKEQSRLVRVSPASPPSRWLWAPLMSEPWRSPAVSARSSGCEFAI